MNCECVHMEVLRMRTGLKLVNYCKCSGLAGSPLPDHTSSFFLLSSLKAPVFCLGFAVCLMWLMLQSFYLRMHEDREMGRFTPEQSPKFVPLHVHCPER